MLLAQIAEPFCFLAYYTLPKLLRKENPRTKYQDRCYLVANWCTGHETVGVVAAIGEQVKGFKIGERVVAECVFPCSTSSFQMLISFQATLSFAMNASTADAANFCSVSISRLTG